MLGNKKGQHLFSALIGALILSFVGFGIFYSYNNIKNSSKTEQNQELLDMNFDSIAQIVRAKSYLQLKDIPTTSFDENITYSVEVTEYKTKRTNYKKAKITINYKDEKGNAKQKINYINKLKENFSYNATNAMHIDSDNESWYYISTDDNIEGKYIGFVNGGSGGWRSPKSINIPLDGEIDKYYLHIKVYDDGACAGLFGDIVLPEDSGFIFEGTGTRQIFAEPVNRTAWKISSTGWNNYQTPVTNYCYAWGNSIWYNTDNNYHGARNGYYTTTIINTYNNHFEI